MADSHLQGIYDVMGSVADGYVERDLSRIDEFVAALFGDARAALVLGTSDREVFVGKEAIASLFNGDWENWGDVKFVGTPTLLDMGDVAVASCRAGVQYAFADDEETYAAFVGLVKGTLAGGDAPGVKLTYANWLLAHLLSTREPGPRSYMWPLRVTAVLSKAGERWAVRQMQFSVPVSDMSSPDVRIECASHYQNSVEADTRKLAEASPSAPGAGDDIRPLLSEFVAELLADGGQAVEMMGEQSTVLDVTGDAYEGKQSIGAWRRQLNLRWDTLAVDVERTFVDSQGDAAWMTCLGMATRTVAADELYAARIGQLESILDEGLPNREKLFRVRRDIALTLKEAARGCTHTWPVRIQAVATKEEGAWKLRFVQISYPFDCVLEQKLDSDICG